MLDAAGLRPGQRVLDIAAGTGDQTLPAARRVGPTGSVLATDISSSMLELAAEAARDAGLINVAVHVADASELDLPDQAFDAAICRFGLMFVPNLHDALRHVHRVLKPGGKLAALVWSAEARNPYIGIQIQTVREMGRLPSPPPTLVRTVSLSAPGVLEAALSTAGFVDVQVRPVDAPRVFESIEDALSAMRSSSPVRGDLTRDMSELEREAFWAELPRRLGAYVQPGGSCALPGEALLGVGTR
jgi:SAM-dependent methyltransferase